MKRDASFETHPTAARRQRLAALESRREIACSRCPPHDGENRGRRPRADRYKAVRKGR